MSRFFLYCLCLFAAGPALAAPGDLLQGYEVQARQANPQFQAFSAARGEQFYHAKRPHGSGKARSVVPTCHTDNPKSVGRNEKTGKEILPLGTCGQPRSS